MQGVDLDLQTRLFQAFFEEAWVADWFAGKSSSPNPHLILTLSSPHTQPILTQ